MRIVLHLLVPVMIKKMYVILFLLLLVGRCRSQEALDTMSSVDAELHKEFAVNCFSLVRRWDDLVTFESAEAQIVLAPFKEDSEALECLLKQQEENVANSELGGSLHIYKVGVLRDDEDADDLWRPQVLNVSSLVSESLYFRYVILDGDYRLQISHCLDSDCDESVSSSVVASLNEAQVKADCGDVNYTAVAGFQPNSRLEFAFYYVPCSEPALRYEKAEVSIYAFVNASGRCDECDG